MLGKFFGFGKQSTSPPMEPAKPGFDRKALIDRLDMRMRFFTEAFYDHFEQMMPPSFGFAYDDKAPSNIDLKSDRTRDGREKRISLCFSLWKKQLAYKYGTGRVELRGKYFFAKTVTWKTPRDFLHQGSVYQLIKRYYPEIHVGHNQSKTANGFTLKDHHQIITLEVFGAGARNSFLACDITLHKNNQPLARDRAVRFLNFYGELYNEVHNGALRYKISESSPDFSDIQFVEDRIPNINDQKL